MDMTTHDMSSLFAQLGLPNADHEIEQFIQSHRLDEAVNIVDADFWTEGQRQFLRQSLRLDADWSPIVDDLNALLRH
jgi:hypothetical protein